TRGLDHAALARRLGFGRSTLYRYLARLQEAGFVEEVDGRGRYRLGPRILYLAAVMHKRDFSELARDYVRELAAETGETTHATVFDFARDVVGTLSITVVGARLGRDEVARLVGPLRQSAEAFSRRLGALAPVEAES